MLQSVFFRRLFVPYLVLVCLAVGSVGAFAGLRLRSSYIEQRRQSLRDQLHLVTRLVGDDVRAGRSAALRAAVESIGAELGCRVTVLREDGGVVADNWAEPAEMDNHAARPEVLEAVREGEGFSTRRSTTIRDEMLYIAGRLGEGAGYLRLAVPIRELERDVQALYAWIGGIAVVAAALAGVVGFHFARRSAGPVVDLKNLAEAISRGDFDKRAAPGATGEVGRLGSALNQMSESIRELVMRAASGQAELLTILSSMSEGVVATDPQQNILLVNDAAADLLGFERADAQGKPLWKIVRVDRIMKAAQEVLAGGEKRLFELGMVRGRHLEISLSPFPAGQPGEGLVLVVHDTTQSVRYQELRREFVANVSHELRTPLTVIKGFVETLRDGAMHDPAKGPEYLATIERHADQLTNLVNDLLELSKLESQVDVPRSVSVDLAVIARKAADLLATAARRKNQTLTVETHRVPLIAGNPDYLERAVANLIDNAVKYTPEGGRIAVATKANGSAVLVEVSDNGLGIPAADIPRIFERFYRVDRSRSREMGGTGLGLSIVKHIVQAHGGVVEVNSTPGEGSTFRFRLPFPQAASE